MLESVWLIIFHCCLLATICASSELKAAEQRQTWHPACGSVLTDPYGFVGGFWSSAGEQPGQCSWVVRQGSLNRVLLLPVQFNLPAASGSVLVLAGDSLDSEVVLGTAGSNGWGLRALGAQPGPLTILYRPSAVSAAWHLHLGFNLSYQLEGDCIVGHQRACPEGGYCYSSEEACDGRWHCPISGADELHCPTCPLGQFACGGVGAGCYPPAGRCDGLRHCASLADELRCSGIRCRPGNGTFLCSSGMCIPHSFVCDGLADCADSDDEAVDVCGSLTLRPGSALIGVVSACGLALVCLLIAAYACRVCQLRTVYAAAGLRLSACRPDAASLESPVARLVAAEMRRRRPPPDYEQAMRDSVPCVLLPPAAEGGDGDQQLLIA